MSVGGSIWGFPKSGVLFESSHNMDYNIWGFVLEYFLFGETTMYAKS